MKIKLTDGLADFDLVDNTGKIYSSHRYSTTGILESEIPLDIKIGSQSIQLTPKINRIDAKNFTIDGRQP